MPNTSTSEKVAISVYIIAKNEEDRIQRAIRSVIDWVDEVVVVDSGSEDDTVCVATKAGAHVLYYPWSGYGPQKRLAEDHCRNTWLFNLDADEEVSPALAAEIQSQFRGSLPDCAAFEMRVTDMLPGETRPKWFAYSYRIMRLYDRRAGRCSPHPYKDRVEINSGKIAKLNGKIWHFSFRDWRSMIAKINFYTSQVAEDRAHRPSRWLRLRLFFEFPIKFVNCYLGRRFIFRGSMGLAWSITVAYLNLLRLLKTAEAQQSLSSHPTIEANQAA
ncbi:MAG: glycosyltransferase family 2 protein [Planctomycetota bacterium]